MALGLHCTEETQLLHSSDGLVKPQQPLPQPRKHLLLGPLLKNKGVAGGDKGGEGGNGGGEKGDGGGGDGGRSGGGGFIAGGGGAVRVAHRPQSKQSVP